MLEKIISYLAQQLDVSADDLDANTTFESLNLDSLDMAEMIIDMEEEVGEIVSPLLNRVIRSRGIRNAVYLCMSPTLINNRAVILSC